MKNIIIATKNKGKASEYQQMLNNKNVEVKTLLDLDEVPEIKEDGNTFEENATIKAKKVMHQTNQPVLADDSGLKVDSLNEEPGVYSARYAGDHNDEANLAKLLYNLKDAKDRKAKFITCLVLLKPGGHKLVVNGQLDGEILRAPKGQNGFGYDPVFYVPDKKKSLAEMDAKQKDEISHRGIALRKMLNHFDQWWQK